MNAVVKIIVLSLALFIMVSIIALVFLSYLSSRGIDALPENVWEELHSLKTQVYDNTFRHVLHNFKHTLFQALHLESSLFLLTPLNPLARVSSTV